MNFQEAHAKLQEVANGEYNSIGYELTTHTKGKLEQSCRLYVHPSLSGIGDTWDQAFVELDKEMNPNKSFVEVDESIDELP